MYRNSLQSHLSIMHCRVCVWCVCVCVCDNLSLSLSLPGRIMPPTCCRVGSMEPSSSWREGIGASSPPTSWHRSSNCQEEGRMLPRDTSHSNSPDSSEKMEQSKTILILPCHTLTSSHPHSLFMSQHNSVTSFQSNPRGGSPLSPPFSGSLYRAGSSPSLNQAGYLSDRLSMEDRIRHSLRVRIV